MGRRVLLFCFTTLLAVKFISGQETGYGFGYQTIIIDNPAVAGCEGDGIMRLSYMNHYPGRNYNLQSFFVSYDSFFPLLHGGLGAYVLNDHLGGVVNDLRGGFSYSYHLQADRNIFLNAGLSASFFRRGININNIILPDQIDPLNGYSLPSGETIDIRGRTVLDVGTGFMLFAGRYFGGLSINHLTRPGIAASGSDAEKLHRKYTIHIAGSFNLDSKQVSSITPVISGELQGERITAGTGAVVKAGIISLSAVLVFNNNPDMNLRTGFAIQKGSAGIFYNYSFNIVSPDSLVPMSLMHQAGLSVSLNDVDKRKAIKTINFPYL